MQYKRHLLRAITISQFPLFGRLRLMSFSSAKSSTISTRDSSKSTNSTIRIFSAFFKQIDIAFGATLSEPQIPRLDFLNGPLYASLSLSTRRPTNESLVLALMMHIAPLSLGQCSRIDRLLSRVEKACIDRSRNRISWKTGQPCLCSTSEFGDDLAIYRRNGKTKEFTFILFQ